MSLDKRSIMHPTSGNRALEAHINEEAALRHIQDVTKENEAAQRHMKEVTEAYQAAERQAEELAREYEGSRQEVAELRQTVEDRENQVSALTARLELMTRREKELREMFLDAHDQLLRRDEEIQ